METLKYYLGLTTSADETKEEVKPTSDTSSPSTVRTKNVGSSKGSFRPPPNSAPKKIMDALNECNLKMKLKTHKAVSSISEHLRLIQDIDGTLTRNILFEDRSNPNKQFLFIIDASKLAATQNRLALNINALAAHLDASQGLKFVQDLSPLALLFDTSRRIHAYLDASLQSAPGLIMRPNVKHASISLNPADFATYCNKYSNSLQYLDFSPFLRKPSDSKASDASKKGAKTGKKTKKMDAKASELRLNELNVSIASHDHWVHVPTAFCARMSLNQQDSYTPPWFAGIFASFASCTSFAAKTPFDACNIVLIWHSAEQKVSLLHCDGYSRHAFVDEVCEFYLMRNKRNKLGEALQLDAEEKKRLRQVKMIVFGKKKCYHAFEKCVVGTASVPKEVKVKFVNVPDTVETIGVPNNQVVFEKLDSRDYSLFYDVFKQNSAHSQELQKAQQAAQAQKMGAAGAAAGQKRVKQILSHPNEWQLECARNVAIFLFAEKLERVRVPWVIFDVQHFRGLLGQKWFVLNDVLNFLNTNFADKKVDIVRCADELLQHLNARDQKSLQQMDGQAEKLMARMMELEDPGDGDGGEEDQKGVRAAGKASEADLKEIKEIEAKLKKCDEMDASLLSAANAVQVIIRDFDVFGVVSNNAKVVKDALSQRYGAWDDEKNDDAIGSDAMICAARSETSGRMQDLMERYYKYVPIRDKKEIVYYCDLVADICKQGKELQKQKQKGQKGVNEKIAQLVHLNDKLTDAPCDQVRGLSQFEETLQRHLGLYVNFVANGKKHESMQFVTHMGLELFKQKDFVKAISYFNVAYQLATMCVVDPSLDLAKSEYNCGATYQECLKMAQFKNNEMMKQHAIMYLKASYQHRNILLKIAQGVQVEETMHQIALKKISKRLEQTGI